jgi:tellurite resistance protein TehA-like permease
MDIIFFFILVILFVLAVSFVLKQSRKKTKNLLLVGSVATLMILTLVLVGDYYRKWDARQVIFLFLAAAILGLFFALRRGFYK